MGVLIHVEGVTVNSVERSELIFGIKGGEGSRVGELVRLALGGVSVVVRVCVYAVSQW